MFLDLTGKEMLDRLPVVISGAGECQLLSVLKLQSSTGEAQALAIYGEKWRVSLNI